MESAPIHRGKVYTDENGLMLFVFIPSASLYLCTALPPQFFIYIH